MFSSPNNIYLLSGYALFANLLLLMTCLFYTCTYSCMSFSPHIAPITNLAADQLMP